MVDEILGQFFIISISQKLSDGVKEIILKLCESMDKRRLKKSVLGRRS